MGNFDRVAAEISPLGQPVPDNYKRVAGSSTTVKLTLIVTEKSIVKKIKWQGNKKLSKGALSDVIALKTRDPLEPMKLREDELKLLAKYNEKGFLDATVDSRVETDTTTLQSIVTFIVAEGVKSKIFWVNAHGVKSFKQKRVLKRMKTVAKGLRRAS